jgi:hypothetical protein
MGEWVKLYQNVRCHIPDNSTLFFIAQTSNSTTHMTWNVLMKPDFNFIVWRWGTPCSLVDVCQCFWGYSVSVIRVAILKWKEKFRAKHWYLFTGLYVNIPQETDVNKNIVFSAQWYSALWGYMYMEEWGNRSESGSPQQSVAKIRLHRATKSFDSKPNRFNVRLKDSVV